MVSYKSKLSKETNPPSYTDSKGVKVNLPVVQHSGKKKIPEGTVFAVGSVDKKADTNVFTQNHPYKVIEGKK